METRLLEPGCNARLLAIREKMIKQIGPQMAIVICAIAIAILAAMLINQTGLFHPHKGWQLAFVFVTGVLTGLWLLRIWPLKPPPNKS
jgi:uncharacterized membrane protein